MSEKNTQVPMTLDLTPSNSLDLSHLPEQDRVALIKEFHQGTIDLTKKANELRMDSQALARTLEDLTNSANKASLDNNAFTASHVQKSALGHTEIMIGNTETAARGKLNGSQRGEKNMTPYYIFAAIIAIVLIAVLGK